VVAVRDKRLLVAVLVRSAIEIATLDRLRALRARRHGRGLRRAAGPGRRPGSAPCSDWLALLIDREVADRNNRRFRTRLRAAALRHVGAAIEDVDYRTPRRLGRALFQRLAPGTWIEERRNLLITGPCGAGRTWLARALGQKACRDNRTVLYKRLPRLFAELELAHSDGRFPRLFRSLVRVDPLILDDWGPDRMTAGQRRDLMEIVEDRSGTGSTLVTSQLPVDAWWPAP
jgi:DNA replication protein DnaC